MNAQRDIRGVLIQIAGSQLLLPNAATVEVLSYADPDPVDNAPDWLLELADSTITYRLNLPGAEVRIYSLDGHPVEPRDLGKEYKLYPSPRARFKALLTGTATHRSHWALRDVSFE